MPNIRISTPRRSCEMDPSQVSLDAQSPDDHTLANEATVSASERSIKFMGTVRIHLVFSLDADYTEDDSSAC